MEIKFTKALAQGFSHSSTSTPTSGFFITTRGHYESLVMHFGLSNTTSVFQSFINDVLRDLIGRFVIAYIDDILIYLPDYDTHVHQVRQVLQCLLENSLELVQSCHNTVVLLRSYTLLRFNLRNSTQQNKSMASEIENF